MEREAVSEREKYCFCGVMNQIHTKQHHTVQSIFDGLCGMWLCLIELLHLISFYDTI